MLFFKPKADSIDILPPPVPSRAAKALSHENAMDDLMKELRDVPTAERDSVKSEKTIEAKKQKIPEKKKALPSKQHIPSKHLKKEKLQKKPVMPKEKGIKQIELQDLDQELGIENFNLDLHELKPSKKEIKLPETLDELDFEDFKADSAIPFETPSKSAKAKPQEVIEAEEEIKTAIQKIKESEKPSLLKRLFAKKVGKGAEVLQPIQDIKINKVSAIQDSIINARQALMKFDLETAKQNYFEIMKLYNDINPEEQAKVYHDIRDLYFERKSAEQLKA